MSYLKDREIWLSKVPTGNPPAGFFWKFIQNGKVVVRDSSGNDQMMIATSGSQAITGSLIVTGGITGTVSSASYVEYSNVANKPTLVSGSSQVTFLGLSSIPSGIVSGSSQVAQFGYATTGSNGFNGSQSITGSLTVTGQVIAQTLNVQQVTSSIVYSSGSNVFGNNSGNTHRFTGSLAVTGAGTFSSSVTATNNILINSGSASTASAGGTLWLTTNNGTSRAAGIQAITQTTDNAHDLLFYTNQSFDIPRERMRITSTGSAIFSGSVAANGIRSINPGVDGTFADAFIGVLSTSNNETNAIQTTVSGTASSSGFRFQVSNGNFSSDRTSVVDFLRDRAIFNTNVGIGVTDTQTFRLAVNGPNVSQGDANTTIRIFDTTSATTGTGGGISFAGYFDGTTSFANTLSYIKGGKENSTAGNFAAYLSFGTRVNDGAPTERMRITSGGNVLIGTITSNNHKLEIIGGTTSGLRIDVNSGVSGIAMSPGAEFNIDQPGVGGGTFKINSSGNVGINTNSPADKLEIKSGYLRMFDPSSGINAGYAIQWSSNNGGTNVTYANIDAVTTSAGNRTGDLLFRTSNAGAPTDKMRITSGGNVGIGTTPNANFILDITSTKASGASGMRLTTQSTSAGPIFVFNYTGSTLTNWGIGAHQSTSGALEFVSSSPGGDPSTAGTSRMLITSGGIIYALNSGVDGNYQPMIGGMYSANNNETNLISTAVSSVAAQSGFQFDVSNGAGSTARTTSMRINRSSVTIIGALSKGSGSFKIDHPLPSKKNTHHLVHSFIEGPQADNIYRGKIQLVNGRVTINLDQAARMTEGTFVLLNGNIQCFTSNESGWTAVKGVVEENILTIEAQDTNCVDTVSWLVVGERIDQHMLDTEWTDENGKVITEPLKQ